MDEEEVAAPLLGQPVAVGDEDRWARQAGAVVLPAGGRAGLAQHADGDSLEFQAIYPVLLPPDSCSEDLSILLIIE